MVESGKGKPISESIGESTDLLWQFNTAKATLIGPGVGEIIIDTRNARWRFQVTERLAWHGNARAISLKGKNAHARAAAKVKGSLSGHPRLQRFRVFSQHLGAHLRTAKLQADVMLIPRSTSRRSTSRIAGLTDLWVFWDCKKHEGLSRVVDLSVGGLCLAVDKSERMVAGEKFHLNFLAPEGQIRTDAVVRHIRPQRLGLKFVAIKEEDRLNLTALMTRLRGGSRPQGKV